MPTYKISYNRETFDLIPLRYSGPKKGATFQVDAASRESAIEVFRGHFGSNCYITEIEKLGL